MEKGLIVSANGDFKYSVDILGKFIISNDSWTGQCTLKESEYESDKSLYWLQVSKKPFKFNKKILPSKVGPNIIGSTEITDDEYLTTYFSGFQQIRLKGEWYYIKFVVPLDCECYDNGNPLQGITMGDFRQKGKKVELVSIVFDNYIRPHFWFDSFNELSIEQQLMTWMTMKAKPLRVSELQDFTTKKFSLIKINLKECDTKKLTKNSKKPFVQFLERLGFFRMDPAFIKEKNFMLKNTKSKYCYIAVKKTPTQDENANQKDSYISGIYFEDEGTISIKDN